MVLLQQVIMLVSKATLVEAHLTQSFCQVLHSYLIQMDHQVTVA